MDNVKGLRKYMRALGSACVSVGAAIMLLMLLMLFGPDAESQFYPVLTRWKVTDSWPEGNNLVVVGHVIKQRQCSYLPPVRALDETGLNYPVVSRSLVPTRSWNNSDRPQKFGPWIVENGVGHTLTFYSEHQCHPLWTTISELGRVDRSGQ